MKKNAQTFVSYITRESIILYNSDFDPVCHKYVMKIYDCIL